MSEPDPQSEGRDKPDFSAVPEPELLRRAEEAVRRDPDPDGKERWSYVYELHNRGGKETFERSVKWCSDADLLLRCLGADVLARLGWDEDHPFGNDSLQPLNRLLEDSEPDVVSCALVAFGHLKRGDPARLVEFAMHACACIRLDLAWCLGGREDVLSQDTLIALSTDEDEDVRDWATFGIARLTEADSPAIRTMLTARLDDPFRDVRLEAIAGLVARGVDGLAPALLKELEADGAPTWAFEVAKEIGSPILVPVLEDYFEGSPDSEELRSALERCRATR